MGKSRVMVFEIGREQTTDFAKSCSAGKRARQGTRSGWGERCWRK